MKKTLSITLLLLSFQIIRAQQSYSLEQCRALAMENNKRISMSQERVTAAEELRKAAFTQYLPRISANGAWLWNEKSISLLHEDALLPVGTKMPDGSFGFRQDQIKNQWMQVSPGVYAPLDASGKPFDPKVNPEKIIWKDYALLPKEAVEMDIHNLFVAGVGLSQPLFLGGKIRELNRIAKSSEKIARSMHEKEIEDILTEVDEAYWRVVSVKGKCAIAQEYLNLLTLLEKNIQEMVKEGLLSKGDLLKVGVKRSEAELINTKALNGLTLSLMSLSQICGLDPNSITSVVEEDISANPNLKEGLSIEDVYSNRVELKALGELTHIAESNLKIMKSRYMPNVLLTANYLITNPNAYNGIENKFGGMFNAGLAVNIPIFHFGDKNHTLRAAKSQLRVSELKTEEAKELIKLQLKQSEYKITEAVKRMETSQYNLERVTENLRFATEAFKEGVVPVSDVLEAQVSWVAAKSELTDSKIEYNLCILYLNKAQGKDISK